MNTIPRKALVVEDVALIRMTTVDMLTEIGIESVEAGDGKSALELLSTEPDIGIVIADLGLPDMSGNQLTVEIRRVKPGVRIVIASGAASASISPDLADAVFLPKPFDLEQLRRAIVGTA